MCESNRDYNVTGPAEGLDQLLAEVVAPVEGQMRDLHQQAATEVAAAMLELER